jgi:alkyldihydroxyacetonephosphate synthase
MNRIRWIDPENRMACIEAGAVGREIVESLSQHGFTMGHEPDSIEFSTLGGWIATHASGMKKNRYGNIEDLVLDVSAVSAAGVLARSSVSPRESIGVDLRRCLYGSEGNLGIVTHATVKLFPLPEVQHYQSVVFRNFEAGFGFLYELEQQAAPPASVRLTDNLQFQFSRALKPASIGLRRLKGRLEKFYVTRVRQLDPDEMVACTLLFEGSRDEVAAQESALFRIARKHGGLKAGAENGKRGYELTFAIAYIRDFMMDHYLLGESFETSVSWSDALALCENVKRRIREDHAARGLPGVPFISCRITQLYDTGVCVYFYFAYYYKGVDRPSEVFAEMEHAAREEVLRSGGSLSHHHGIGKLRDQFLPEIMSAPLLEWSRQIKRAVDPQNVFGSANHGVGGGESPR